LQDSTGYEQTPPAHVPWEAWHASGGELQVNAGPAVQVPDWQVLGLQRSVPQLVLFAKFGYVHWPVLGLQVAPAAVWHSGGALQATGGAEIHEPAWQVLGLQRSVPQDVPLVAGTQAPDEHVEQPVHVLPLFCQAPLASQVCGWDPLHRVAPGVQPAHEHELTQVAVLPSQKYWQRLPLLCQTPLASQIWGCKPLHCLAPGVQPPEHVHAPVQVPVFASQAVGQRLPLFCQVPVASQVWGCKPLHRLAAGVQTPVQVPVVARQTYWHGDPVFCQAPLASQVWGCRPLHCLAAGVQVGAPVAVIHNIVYPSFPEPAVRVRRTAVLRLFTLAALSPEKVSSKFTHVLPTECVGPVPTRVVPS
jgi:hypothetical protein